MRTEDARFGGSWERVGAASGAAYALLLIVGGSMMTAGTSESTNPAGEEALASWQHIAETGSAKLGLGLALLAFAAFAVFLSYLHGVLRRVEGPDSWLPTSALVAGVLALVIKWGSASFVGAAIVRSDELSPDLARTLNDLDSAAFWASWLPYAVFVGVSALVILRTRFVPSAFGWIGLVLAVAGVATSVSVDVGMSENGAAPYLLSVLWVLALSMVLAVRGPRPVAEPSAPRVAVAA
ncbi:MAG: hypothetical protein ABJA93_12760 [Sporichthyaceae bacterium]